jgi:hypothetical protein
MNELAHNNQNNRKEKIIALTEPHYQALRGKGRN